MFFWLKMHRTYIPPSIGIFLNKCIRLLVSTVATVNPSFTSLAMGFFGTGPCGSIPLTIICLDVSCTIILLVYIEYLHGLCGGSWEKAVLNTVHHCRLALWSKEHASSNALSNTSDVYDTNHVLISTYGLIQPPSACSRQARMFLLMSQAGK